MASGTTHQVPAIELSTKDRTIVKAAIVRSSSIKMAKSKASMSRTLSSPVEASFETKVVVVIGVQQRSQPAEAMTIATDLLETPSAIMRRRTTIEMLKIVSHQIYKAKVEVLAEASREMVRDGVARVLSRPNCPMDPTTITRNLGSRDRVEMSKLRSRLESKI